MLLPSDRPAGGNMADAGDVVQLGDPSSKKTKNIKKGWNSDFPLKCCVDVFFRLSGVDLRWSLRVLRMYYVVICANSTIDLKNIDLISRIVFLFL